MATIRRLWSTKHRLRILAIIFGVSMIYVLPFLAIPGMAAIYMKIDGIDGEVVDKTYAKWIELDSISWGTSRGISSPTGGGGRETLPPSISDVTVSKRMDSASARLFFEAVAGVQGKSASIHLTRTVDNMPVTYYEMTLSDVLVSSFSQGAGSGDIPNETISLNFTKIGVKYTPYTSGKAGTPISHSYDLTTGKVQ